MQFPLRLAIKKIDQHAAALVEVNYDIVDATGGIIQSTHFYCKPADVEEVAAYTLERLSVALAQPNKHTALERVDVPDHIASRIANWRGDAPPPSPPAPTPFDQTVSPPGVGGVKVTR